MASLGFLNNPVDSLNFVHTSESPLIKTYSFEPLDLHPVSCCDLDFALKYLAPDSLGRTGSSPTTAFWDVFHQSEWNHFSTCIIEIIPTWSLICSIFPKFQRIRGHTDVIVPILDPYYLVTTIAFPKQEWCFQNTVLITVSRPTLLLPAVNTNTGKALPGGIKVDKQKRRENLGFSFTGMPVVAINNAVLQIPTHLPYSRHRKGLYFLVSSWHWVGSYN